MNSSMGIKVHRLGYFVHVKPMELSKRTGLLIRDGVTISIIGLKSHFNNNFLTNNLYLVFQELFPHDDLYPSQYDRVLEELAKSSTGQITMCEYPETIAECCSKGTNFNRMFHQSHSLFSIICNVQLPHGQCLPVTDPVRIQELSKEFQPHL